MTNEDKLESIQDKLDGLNVFVKHLGENILIKGTPENAVCTVFVEQIKLLLEG